MGDQVVCKYCGDPAVYISVDQDTMTGYCREHDAEFWEDADVY